MNKLLLVVMCFKITRYNVKINVMNKIIILIIPLLFLTGQKSLFAQVSQPPLKSEELNSKSDTLLVVWSSGDPEVAEKVCFMYTYNAKKWGWFKEVIFVVWGPSAKLLAENKDLQESIRKMEDEGVILEACVACARMYGVEDDLAELGIDVKGMGTVLTEYLKRGYPNITF
jgi:hypothetical protein